MSREGAARPVSTKLKCRAEISASPARSSWLMRRRCRHSRKWSPIWTGWLRSACAVDACAFMVENLARRFRPFHYVGGNRIGARAGASWVATGDDHDRIAALPDRHRPASSLGHGARNPDAGAQPQHAGAAGAFDRRLRRRAGHGLRAQRRQEPLPVPPRPPAPRLVAWIALSFTSSPPQPWRPTMIDASTFLRRALLADAIFSGVAALGFTFGASAFASLFNLPEALLRETGLFLIAYTALVGWLASRASVARPLVLLVVVGNAAWTVGSIALLLSGAVSPNLAGELMVVAQAIATGVFAELQYVGLRRSGSVLAA